MCAITHEPEDRYVSAEAVADEIRRWLADEPVEVYPEPRWARLERWARKHQPVVAGIGVLLVATIIALGVGITLVDQERNRTQIEKIKVGKERMAAINEANSSRGLALDLRGIIGGSLPMTPGTEFARARFADALVRHVTGSMSSPNNDLNSQSKLDMVDTLHEAATARAVIGLHADALMALRSAQKVIRDLIAAEPDWPIPRARLADILLDDGQMHHLMGEMATAYAIDSEAEAAAEWLINRHPNEASFRRIRAFARAGRSATARELGRLDEAITLGRSALVDYDQIVKTMSETHPPNLGVDPWVVLLLRESMRRSLGVSLIEAKQFEEGDRLIAESTEEIKRLGVDRPDNNHSAELASSYLARGNSLAHAPTTRREAIGQFDLAIKESATLARDFPGIFNYRSTLARAKSSRARAIRDLLRDSPTPEVEAFRSQAERDAEEAISILERISKGSHTFNGLLARALEVLASLKNDPELLKRAMPLEEGRQKRQPDGSGIAPKT